jgi:hypothetical protein
MELKEADSGSALAGLSCHHKNESLSLASIGRGVQGGTDLELSLVEKNRKTYLHAVKYPILTLPTEIISEIVLHYTLFSLGPLLHLYWGRYVGNGVT